MPTAQLAAQRLHYDRLGPKDGPPLLLMHGFMQVGRDMLLVANALSAAGYAVIVPDLPGYGRSTPPNRTFPADFYTRDALIMAELLDHLGGGPTHIVGFSDGGEVALLLAILRPELARTCIAWGAVGSVTGEIGSFAAATPPIIDPAKRARHPGQPVETWRQLWLNGFLSYLDRGGDISIGRAAQIGCPLLLMVGEHDGLNPVSEAERFIRQAMRSGTDEDNRGPLRRLKVFRGSGHAIHEEQPDAFLDAVFSFLRDYST